jgi:4-carboxymuconolactone decarboxylase
VSERPEYSPKAIARGAALFGEKWAMDRLDDLAKWDEEYAKLFADYVYGGMYDRDVIDQKTRELCAVSALVVLGRDVLAPHMRAALRCGATPAELAEVVFQMSVYGGFPATLAAIKTLRKVLKEEGLSD